MKDFLKAAALGRSDLETLLGSASRYRNAIDSSEPIDPVLEGRCVANLFFEPSTRTRLSFDLAAQRLGAHVLTFNPGTSSTTKGETLRDTVGAIAAIGADIIVVRHADDGVPQAVAEWTGLPVVNAGDGTSEHPTQALVDAATLTRHFGGTDGLKMLIVGDIAHSRVAGSLVHTMPLLGIELTLVGPTGWVPKDTAVRTTSDMEGALAGADVVYLLRVQTERGGQITTDYVEDYQLNRARLGLLRHSAVIMHAGPMNRGVEIGDDVADSPRAIAIEQVRNGVPARMAVLAALAAERR